MKKRGKFLKKKKKSDFSRLTLFQKLGEMHNSVGDGKKEKGQKYLPENIIQTKNNNSYLY